MRDYRLYELSEDAFEHTICHVCRIVLGAGVINFSKGKDGGRDGRFEGTAQKYPSATSPWGGKFIIQAKHTSNQLASCSDNDFLKNQTSIVNKEIPRIKELFENGEIDNYLLFTNRKLSGAAENDIRTKIIEKTGVRNVSIIGVETLSGYFGADPELIRSCHLDQLIGPLRFHPEELRDIIAAFHEQYVVDDAGNSGRFSFKYFKIEEKNELNRLSERFFNLIQQHSELYFREIEKFLQNPVNDELREQYYNIADEFNNKLTIRRDQFGAFEEVFEILYDHVIEKVPALKDKGRLINVFLHYMYCSCDIGEKC